MSSGKVALSQGRYTWRHDGVLQELATVISMTKGQSTHQNADAVIFTTEEGAKSWHGMAVKKKCLLDGCETGKFQQIFQYRTVIPV